jgi:viroplasmin and RNaseH domain-containing protein
MLSQSDSQSEGQDQVYGFLCQKTNVFYAFESFEAYEEFLAWLDRENSLTNNDSM